MAYASGAVADAPEAAIWFLRAITLISIEHRLPGAFADNPYPFVLNGPLWSLFHEVGAYALCCAFVAAGGTARPVFMATLVAAATFAALFADALPGRLATFAPLFAAFAWGMAAHGVRTRLRLVPGVALALLPLVAVAPWPLAIAVLGYAVLALALRVPVLPLPGDISYGIYM